MVDENGGTARPRHATPAAGELERRPAGVQAGLGRGQPRSVLQQSRRAVERGPRLHRGGAAQTEGPSVLDDRTRDALRWADRLQGAHHVCPDGGEYVCPRMERR